MISKTPNAFTRPTPGTSASAKIAQWIFLTKSLYLGPCRSGKGFVAIITLPRLNTVLNLTPLPQSFILVCFNEGTLSYYFSTHNVRAKLLVRLNSLFPPPLTITLTLILIITTTQSLIDCDHFPRFTNVNGKRVKTEIATRKR